MTDLEILSRRLLRLENQYRWLKRVPSIACLLIAAAGVMGQAPPRPQDVRGLIQQLPPRQVTVEQEVRARNFILVDDAGKERASLVTDGAGSVFLILFDKNGRTRADLSVGNDGPSLTFFDPSGQARMVTGSTTRVSSHVSENGVVERAPASSIVMFDRSGKLLWRTP